MDLTGTFERRDHPRTESTGLTEIGRRGPGAARCPSPLVYWEESTGLSDIGQRGLRSQ
jgi:hypothetical protein